MIGVLAVQGAFIEHRRMLEKLGEETFEIRRRADWEDHAPGSNAPMEGLVLPGGESTVMEKLLRELGLFEPLKRYI